MQNYEDVVESALIEGFRQKFGINDDDNLITYLFARYSIFHSVDKITDCSQFINFVFQELAIAPIGVVDGMSTVEFFYYDEYALIHTSMSDSNSFVNIFDSISNKFFNQSFSLGNGDLVDAKTYLTNIVSDIQRRAKLKLKPYKNSKYKNELLLLFKLNILNEKFCIKDPIEAPRLSEFNQREHRFSVENLYRRYLHAENFDTKNVHSVTEAQVRDYLYTHIELIEDGMRPIMKEFPTKEGRVDIVARDSNNNLVVIEVKTENDKRLIWQCMYYPGEVKKELGKYEDCIVRMITIAPEYPEFISNPLRSIGNIESYTYSIVASNNVIESIEVKKFDNAMKCEEADCNHEVDDLIDLFIYTKRNLEKKCESNRIECENIDDVALKLLEIYKK